jgi:hypothetical protein
MHTVECTACSRAARSTGGAAPLHDPCLNLQGLGAVTEILIVTSILCLPNNAGRRLGDLTGDQANAVTACSWKPEVEAAS